MALWIGLMSGTSADGVDAALVRIPANPSRLELVARAALPFEESLRARIHGVVGRPVPLRDLVALDVELGGRFADAALEVIRVAGLRPTDVCGIGSHGQTVGHFPEPAVRGTLQIGSAAVIHARTGIPVVSDFRSADLAVGGQGAPLTPFVHHLLFAHARERRAVLNIGGFTNVTWLPGRATEGVIAFDPGPGNALLDRAARTASGGRERFDAGGARARRGRVLDPVLRALLADPYFDKPPPKSTGHEHFGDACFERARSLASESGGQPDDLCATLAALTVESVARAAERFLPALPERWLVCGGGALNPALLEGLSLRVAPGAVETTAEHGVPVDALEAIAFAVLGHQASRGKPNHLPTTTGATRAVILGSVTPPGSTGRKRREAPRAVSRRRT